MITEADSGNILYRDCKKHFGDIVEQTLNAATGKVTKERIVVVPKTQQESSIWIKNYIEINWLIPDLTSGKADLIRLQEVERSMKKTLLDCGRYDSTPYFYRVTSTEIKNEENLSAHYANARILFHSLNTKTE
jgi:hypothetical protein